MRKIEKYTGNPVLSAADIPYDAGLIFNAGVAFFNGRYVMVFRNDYGFAADLPNGRRENHGTNLGVAFSKDGYHWEVAAKPWIQMVDDPEIYRFYDPRLTVIDGRCYLCFAVDTRHGVRGGIAVTDDFDKFDILTMTVPENRNMVLFPEKINGRYVRLERPFPEYSRGYQERFDVWMSASPDLRYWGDSQLLLGVEHVPFANAKIGPAAPPIKTRKGWLTTFHAVYKDNDRKLNTWENAPWTKEYYGGIMLLDLYDPSKIIGLCRKPLLEATEKYEIEGFRGSVIFPGGMLLDADGEVKIYYGAADTVEALAVTDVEYLLSLCEPL